MTVLVGVRCTDGVVIGADSIATSSTGPMPLVQIQSNDKIQLFPPNVILAATGAVGFTQRLAFHVEQAIKGNVFKNLPRTVSKRFLGDLQASMAQRHPQHGISFGGLIAAPIQGTPCLIEYGTVDFQPEVKEGRLFSVSMGSGQLLADPFLAFVSRVLWHGEMPTVDVAKFGVYWVLEHTVKLAPGGVGGDLHIATLRQRDGAWVTEQMTNTQEASQYTAELEAHIGQFARRTVEAAVGTVPPVPPDLAKPL